MWPAPVRDLSAAVAPGEVAVLVAHLVGEAGAAGDVREGVADPEGLHAVQHVRAQPELLDDRRPRVDPHRHRLRRLGAALRVHRPERQDVLAVVLVVARRAHDDLGRRLRAAAVDLDVRGGDRGDLAGRRERDRDRVVVPVRVRAVGDGHRRRAVDRRRPVTAEPTSASSPEASPPRRRRTRAEQTSAHATTTRPRMVGSSHPLSTSGATR